MTAANIGQLLNDPLGKYRGMGHGGAGRGHTEPIRLL